MSQSTPVTPTYWAEACAHLARKDRVMKKLIPQFGDAILESRGDAFVTLARSIVGQQISVKAAQSVWLKLLVLLGQDPAHQRHPLSVEAMLALEPAVLKGVGQDTLSQSRANGDVAYRLVELSPTQTRVEVDLLYSLQGPLAQFSRSGLVKDFVGRLIQEFGKNVALRMDPTRSPDAALPPARLNAISLGWSVLWSRIRRLFGADG